MEGVIFDKNIHIRVTQEEQNAIRENALSRRVPSRIETKMLSELRRQGGLLKYVFKESQGMYSEKTATALENLNTFITGLEKVVLNDSETPS